MPSEQDETTAVSKRAAPVDTKINVWLAGGILIVLAGVFILVGLIIKRVYYDMPTPRTALERELLEYEDDVARHPDDAGARVRVAQIYYRVGSVDKALTQLKIAKEIDPNLWDVHFAYGTIYLDQNKTKLAIKHLGKARKADPQNELTYYQLGKVYLRQKNYDLSIKNLSAVVKIRPELADAHYDLGSAYEAINKKGEAAREYRQALEYIPEMKKARAALARLAKR